MKRWAKEEGIELPQIPAYATNNAHMFYLVCRDLEQRSLLIESLKEKGILTVFHYLSLHKSPFYRDRYDGRALPESDRYSECLLRLPMFYELETTELSLITDSLKNIVDVH